jgi:hypothetical protein
MTAWTRCGHDAGKKTNGAKRRISSPTVQPMGHQPAPPGPRLVRSAGLDADRVHARVEDAIRTGKDSGVGKYPSESLAMNKAWQGAALTAATAGLAIRKQDRRRLARARQATSAPG